MFHLLRISRVENHAVSTYVYDARGYHAHFLSLRRRKIRRKPKMFLVVIAMQACMVGWFPKDGKRSEMSYKGIVYAFAVSVSSCQMWSNMLFYESYVLLMGAEITCLKCLVYILLWLYMPFSRLKPKMLLIVDLSPNVVNHSFYF